MATRWWRKLRVHIIAFSRRIPLLPLTGQLQGELGSRTEPGAVEVEEVDRNGDEDGEEGEDGGWPLQVISVGRSSDVGEERG